MAWELLTGSLIIGGQPVTMNSASISSGEISTVRTNNIYAFQRAVVKGGFPFYDQYGESHESGTYYIGNSQHFRVRVVEQSATYREIRFERDTNGYLVAIITDSYAGNKAFLFFGVDHDVQEAFPFYGNGVTDKTYIANLSCPVTYPNQTVRRELYQALMNAIPSVSSSTLYIGDPNGIAQNVTKLMYGDPNGIARKCKLFYGDPNGIARKIME